jgi:hypothetical protein
MTLVPNGTADRLKYIAKTFGARPALVLDMIDVIAQAVGEDRWRFAIRDAAHRDATFSTDVEHYGIYSLAGLWRPDKEPPPKAFVDAVVAMASELPGFRGAHPADPLFPWMAVQLNAAAKEADRRWKRDPAMFSPEVHLVDYRTLLDRFRRRGSAMAAWFAATRPDLTKMDANDVYDQIVEWEEEQSTVEAQQGEIVYEFDDGYTVQKLTTEEQLDAEGEAMQHCVGSYCTEVRSGNTVIYSLRDPNGQPHVTIEYAPSSRFVKQIKGKQNDDPAPKYKPYIDAFLETLPKMSAHLQGIYDVLSQADGVDSDEELQQLTHRWGDIVVDGDELKAWLDAGAYAGSPQSIESLRDHDVTPEEYRTLPHLIVRMIDEDRSDADELIRIARFWARLTVMDRPESSQISMGFPERPVDEWPVGQEHPPSWRERKERRQKVSASKHPSSSYHWDVIQADEGDIHDDIETERLYEAEEWSDAEFDDGERWDPTSTDGGSEDFAPWYMNYFTPPQATAWRDINWHRAGSTWIRADTAAVLRQRGIVPEQVQDAVDAKRLWPTDANIPTRIEEAVRSTPNRRRAKR